MGPADTAMVAYRIMVGKLKEPPGTTHLHPVQRLRTTQPTKPAPIPLPKEGQVLVIPMFMTAEHIQVNRDMQ